MIAVLIVDGHPQVRESMRTTLEAQGDIKVAGEAASAQAAVTLAATVRPHVVLLDLPSPPNGAIAAIRRLREQPGPPGVIVLGLDDDLDTALAAVRAGADGYLCKGEQSHALAQAVRTVREGGALLGPQLNAAVVKEYRELVRAFAASDFCERDIAMLMLLARGASNRAIAGELALSPQTVKNLLSDLYARLGACNRAAAVAAALTRGLIVSVDEAGGVLEHSAH